MMYGVYIKWGIMKTYIVNSDIDGNITFAVEAETPEDAAHKALGELGYWIAENDETPTE